MLINNDYYILFHTGFELVKKDDGKSPCIYIDKTDYWDNNYNVLVEVINNYSILSMNMQRSFRRILNIM